MFNPFRDYDLDQYDHGDMPPDENEGWSAEDDLEACSEKAVEEQEENLEDDPYYFMGEY